MSDRHPAARAAARCGPASPYFARSFDGGWSSAGVAARLAVCLAPIGKDQYRGRQCHVKGTNVTSYSGRIHLTALQALESMSDDQLTGKLAIDAAPFVPTAVVSGASTTVQSLSSRRDLDGPTLEP